MSTARQIFVLLVASCGACWAQQHGAAEWNHNPAPTQRPPWGPPLWAHLPGDDNKVCGSGTTQSPIKLPPIGTVKAGAGRVVFHYGTNSTFTAEVWNTQHVIEVCVPKKAEGSESDDHECKGKADRDFYITIPGQEKEFYLKEFHLHAPAEHTYNGQERDLEVHLVHVAKDGATAVIGILMRKAGTDGNAVIKDVMDNVPLGGSEITVNPNLLVATATGFYSYQGSLTTPPCTQGVSWFVATTPGPVNGDDVTKLHRIIKAFKGYGPYENNNRRPMPVRHLNEGEVVLVGRGDGASK